MRESGVHRLHPQNHKHWPKTFGEPFGEFASHMYLRCLALHSEVSDKVSDYTFGLLRTVSDKVSDYAFVHSRTVRPKSPPSQSMWKMGHIRKGCLIRGPLNKGRFSSTPKTWQLSQVCGGGARRAWRLTQAPHPRSFQARSRQRVRRMGCQTGADAAFFDSVPFALLRARREQEPSKLTQQLQAARVRTLNRSVPHDLVAHSCLATCSGVPHSCFVLQPIVSDKQDYCTLVRIGCHPSSLAAPAVFDSQECWGRGAADCPLHRTQDSRGSPYSFPLSRNLIRLQIPLLYASPWSRVCGLRCTQIGRQRRSTEREDYDKRRAQTNAALATGLSELAQLAFRGLCRRVPTGFPREGHSQKCRQPPQP
jgi:hypothetical protein